MAKRKLNIRHIEAFHSVMTTGSMTETAKKLHTSQPQISRLISQLEGIVEFALFHRKGSRFSPTSEALHFSQEVEKAFVGVWELEAAASRIRSFSTSRLSVAAMPRLAGGILAKAVARFKREFPDVLVSIHSGDETSVHSWISSGFCEAGLTMLHSELRGVVVKPALRMDYVALLPKNHPLCELDLLTPEDLDGQRMIGYSSGSSMRETIDEIFRGKGCEAIVTAEAGLGASMCALVSEGLGVALMNPVAAADEKTLMELEVRPFRPAISFDIALIFPEGVKQSRLVETFSQFAFEEIQELATLE